MPVAARARRLAEAPRRYLVELNRLDAGWAALQQTAARARRTVEELRADGRPIRFLRSVYVPEDDACFLLYEAPSEALVREALEKAGLASGGMATTVGADAPLVEAWAEDVGG